MSRQFDMQQLKLYKYFDASSWLEGKIHGKIGVEKVGDQGFGYDPIFKPDAFNETFAEMDLTRKNKISHRGKAIQLLVNFLNY